MKKLIIIPFLFICLILSAQDTYYVSPTGNDAGAGTLGDPWATWGKGFSSALVGAGDTVYFRGGIYYTTANGTGYRSINDGTAGNLIQYWAYPGEKPILDCSNITADDGSNKIYAIYATANYCHFKGLTIRNVNELDANGADNAYGFWVNGAGTTVENCVSHNIEGHGFRIYTGYNFYYINCDAYNCCDTLGTYIAPTPNVGVGENGSGFATNNPLNRTTSVYYINCRAWQCSDQGFTFYDVGYVEVAGCWSFRNGAYSAGGHGYKLGFTPDSVSLALQRKIYNCIGAYNRNDGFTTNDNARVYQNMQLYNNIAYHNGYYPGYSYWGTGFAIFNTKSSDAGELGRVFKNNISYDNDLYAVNIATGALYTHEYNSWDTPPGVTLSDADFVSVDSTGITGARDAEGHLPDLDFLNIKVGSDLIGAGTGVGLIYDADSMLINEPPDLGPYAYASEPPPPPPLPPQVATNEITSYSPYKATITAEIQSDGGGTIGAKGIVWGTANNPTLSNNSVAGWATSDTTFWNVVRALNPNTTYYFRAYVGNENDTTYGEVRYFTTPQMGALKNGTKAIKNGTKIVIY